MALFEGRRGQWLGHHLSLATPQRRVLIGLLATLIGYGGYRLATNRSYIDAPQPPAGDLSTELADRLDPNTASAADLAALPGVGDKRARAIIARRDVVQKREPGAIAFESAEDLFFVAGFGRSTVDSLRPYLVFPAPRPTSRP